MPAIVNKRPDVAIAMFEAAWITYGAHAFLQQPCDDFGKSAMSAGLPPQFW